MDKHLLNALIGIAIIIVFFVYIAVALIIVAVVLGLLWGCYTVYRDNPRQTSKAIYYLIAPLLLVGWLFVGYIIFTNNYYNTYKLSFSYHENYNIPNKEYIITAKNDKDAYIKAWNFFVAQGGPNLATKDDIIPYRDCLFIWNMSKNKKCTPTKSADVKSLIESNRLYIENDSLRIDFLDLTNYWGFN